MDTFFCNNNNINSGYKAPFCMFLTFVKLIGVRYSCVAGIWRLEKEAEFALSVDGRSFPIISFIGRVNDLEQVQYTRRLCKCTVSTGIESSGTTQAYRSIETRAGLNLLIDMSGN